MLGPLGDPGPTRTTPERPAPPQVPANKYAIPRSTLRFFPVLAREQDHPTRWEWPAYLNASGVPWLDELRALYASPLAFPSSISPQAGLLLHSLVLNVRPRIAVEVGTFIGSSTLWIASALAETAKAGGAAGGGGAGGVLHAFDDFGPVPRAQWRDAEFHGDRKAMVAERVERAGLGAHVRLHAGDSPTMIRAMQQELRAAGGVDFALIDGDHTIPGATQDLWAVEPVLNTGGFVVLHDTFPEQCGEHHGPRHILDTINAMAQGLYEKCELYLSPLNYGLGVLRRIG